jgi:dolichyl-phosphate beta-glucosyltransferase
MIDSVSESSLKQTSEIVLVTPVWNDSQRLGRFGSDLARALAASSLPLCWIVSDDGSSVEEQMKLQTLVKQFRAIFPNCELVSSDQRSRKGAAIYRAWDQCAAAEWLAFVDGDGAISASVIVGLIKAAIAEDDPACTIAIRAHSIESPVRRQVIRSLALRVFSFLVRTLVGLKCLDTQCGAKVVPGAAYRKVRNHLRECGYVFDVELLTVFGRNEVSLRQQAIPWVEVPGGKVNLFTDGFRMVMGLLRIRRRLKTGLY